MTTPFDVLLVASPLFVIGLIGLALTLWIYLDEKRRNEDVRTKEGGNQ